MPTSLFQYEMLPTTWFYLSSLLIIVTFFRFNRLLSVRNFDVLTLIMWTPGLAYVAMGSAFQGYLYLNAVGVVVFARLAFDLLLRRRPLLTPNLNSAGLTFACVASTAFIIPNLFINRGNGCESPRAWRLEQILTAAAENDPNAAKTADRPGYRPFLVATEKTNRFFAPSNAAWRRALDERGASATDDAVDFFGVPIRLTDETQDNRRAARSFRAMEWASGRGAENEFSPDFFPPQTVRSAAIPNGSKPSTLEVAPIEPLEPVVPLAPSEISATSNGSAARGGTTLKLEEAALIIAIVALQTGIVVSMILIGRYHFDSLQTGVAAALFYLLHPYVNQFSGCLDHIAPGLAILLAFLFYRRPFVSGVALGVAGSLAFYPFFLLPLWTAFYWKKGAARFAIGASGVVSTFAVALLAAPESLGTFAETLSATFGRGSLFLTSAEGIWEYLPRFYRIPLISLYFVFCVGFALWPPRKNLATLLACSAMLTLGAQFWTGYRGGLYMSWYLPLVVLTVFRPNLEDRIATTTVVDV